MKKSLLVFGLCVLSGISFLFGATSPSGAPAGSAVVEKELIQLEHDWGKAYVARDVKMLARIEADTFTFVSPDGVLLSKAADIESVRSGEFISTTFEQDEIVVRTYGETAVVTGRTTMKATYQGKDISGKYRWTDTWVKLDGRWQCVASQASKIAGD